MYAVDGQIYIKPNKCWIKSDYNTLIFFSEYIYLLLLNLIAFQPFLLFPHIIKHRMSYQYPRTGTQRKHNLNGRQAGPRRNTPRKHYVCIFSIALEKNLISFRMTYSVVRVFVVSRSRGRACLQHRSKPPFVGGAKAR